MKKIYYITMVAVSIFAAFLSVTLLVRSIKERNNIEMKTAESTSWQAELEQLLPLLGHRNWVVITDMAYPLQSGQGIKTIFADEPYPEVVAKVKGMIDGADHVFAHLYRDKELEFITEEMVPGIEAFKSQMNGICGSDAKSVMHEDLIAKLDEAGKLFNVVIIKTPLTIPYTTTFFELDCNYWDAERAAKLDAAIKGAK